jgi:glycosyltransferase involved in cell wall biosynthesis
MISIIIPTLNEEKIIGDTLTRLKDGLQTTKYEIIVSDGNSSDKTVLIAKKHANKVIVYNESTRQTIGQGRNDGARAAKGDYLVFLDADMRIPDTDGFFAKTFSLFEKNPRLAGITVPLRVWPETETFWDRVIFNIVNLVHRFLNNVMHFGSGSGEFQMIRTSTFKKLGGYREDLVATEDNELFTRLAKNGGTIFVASLMAFHSGRRAHKVGWPRLLWSWTTNAVTVYVLNRSSSKEWKPIR